MNELQTRILEIMKWIHSICIENEIKYSLIGGSLIGAIREKGFIPWDDDIDIAMDIRNYDKFVEVSKNYNHERFEILYPLKSDNYPYAFIKVTDKNTTVVENKLSLDIDLTKGIAVDVFPMIQVESEEKARKLIEKRKFYFRLMLMQENKADSIKRKILKSIKPIINYKFFVRQMLKHNKKYENLPYIYDVDGYYCDTNVVPSDWFEDYSLTDFETEKFMIIDEYDKYLRRIFGDYTVRPDVSEQVGHDQTYVNLNLPYREYIKAEKSRIKEQR